MRKTLIHTLSQCTGLSLLLPAFFFFFFTVPGHTAFLFLLSFQTFNCHRLSPFSLRFLLILFLIFFCYFLTTFIIANDHFSSGDPSFGVSLPYWEIHKYIPFNLINGTISATSPHLSLYTHTLNCFST